MAVTMKKSICVLFSFMLLLIVAGCGNIAAEGGQESVSEQPEVQTEQVIGNNRESSETESQEPSESVSEQEQETATEQEQGTDMEQKILVVYFSATGTTEPLAEYAAEILNADLYEIVPEVPYTEEDLAYYTNGRADQEQNDPSSRPALSGSVQNMEEYDMIVIGYPIWHGQAPRIISTFLESYDFSGKTMIPFCTSHSSGIGSSADNLHELCSDSVNWLEGKRFEAETTKEAMRTWLENVIVK